MDKEIYHKLLKMKQEDRASIRKIRKEFKCSIRCAEVYKILIDNKEEFTSIFADSDIAEELVKLSKQKLKYQDTNRIERKTWRNNSRLGNALEEMNNELLKKIDETNFQLKKTFKLQNHNVHNGHILIVQLSDTHFNELVKIDENEYDFNVASKRMRLYAREVIREIQSKHISHVVIAMTGDLINSDRRLDEKMNMATNRMSAAMISVNIIQQFIREISLYVNNVDVLYVSGNESRVIEMGFTDLVATDNYDSIIFNILRMLFKDIDNLNFIDGNPTEQVLSINGKNILFTHGTQFNASVNQTTIQKHIGKYSGQGISIDYVLFGHIHAAYISDLFARSGSLVGGNSYSSYALGLSSRASQNIHLIKDNGAIISTKIDLQDVTDIKGYDISDDLLTYKALSNDVKKMKIVEV